MIGAFATGLLGGMKAMNEIMIDVERLKQIDRDAAAKAEYDKIRKDKKEDAPGVKILNTDDTDGKGAGTGAKPQDEVVTPQGSDGSSLADSDRYLSKLPPSSSAPPKQTAITPPSTVSGAEPESVKPPTQTPPAPAAAEPAPPPPGGQIGFSFDRGLHRTAPGEPSAVDKFKSATVPGNAANVGAAVDNTGFNLGGGLGFSLGRGLYRQGAPAAPNLIPQQNTPPVAFAPIPPAPSTPNTTASALPQLVGGAVAPVAPVTGLPTKALTPIARRPMETEYETDNAIPLDRRRGY